MAKDWKLGDMVDALIVGLVIVFTFITAIEQLSFISETAETIGEFVFAIIVAIVFYKAKHNG
jgi:hypothetical protein